MKDMLLTFGDSFTWGEGLDSHLLIDMFPEWSAKLREWTSGDGKPNEIQRLKYKLTTSVYELNLRRMESTYGYLLNEKLGTTHITNGVNGGSNIDRLVDLDYFIHILKLANDVHPKYCIFQLTHISRDIQHIFEKRWNEDLAKITDSVFPQTFRDDIIGKNYYQWESLGLFDIGIRYVIDSLMERFTEMETKWGTKCIFFFGLGEKELDTPIWEYLRSNPRFVPMIWNEKEYTTFSEIGRLNRLTVRDTTGFHDGHNDNSLHIWLSEYLYTKLI